MTTLTLIAPSASVSPRAARVHAIKNCLAVVFAVQKLLEFELTGQARDRLGRSQRAAQRMLSLLEEELSAGAPAPEPRFCAAGDVLQAVVSRVEDRAASGGVEIVVQSGSGGIHGNGVELVEALTNVVLNAVEVTPPGGAVFVSSYDGGDQTQIWTVQDTGPGMPADTVVSLGTPACSRRPGGWGLGLALARDVVDRHGGLIQVESDVGSGTLVSICIPGRSMEIASAEERILL